MISFMHETIRKPKAARKSPSARHRAFGRRLERNGCGTEDRVFSQFCNSLEEPVQAPRPRCIEAQTSSWSPSQATSPPEETRYEDFAKGSRGVGIPNRFMDSKEDSHSNRERIWRSVPSESLVAIPDKSWLELSETAETGPGTRRKGNPALETVCLAPYKKRLNNWLHTLSFLTKAAFFLFPPSRELGRLKDKLRCFASRGVGPRYRLSRRSLFPRKDEEQHSMPNSIPIRTLKALRWLASSCIWLGIFEGISFCFGMTVALIKEPLSEIFSVNIRGSIFFGSRDTHPNSIQMSSSGTDSNDLSQIAFPKTWPILSDSYGHHSGGCGILKGYFGHVFMHQIYHGDRLSIIYA